MKNNIKRIIFGIVCVVNAGNSFGAAVPDEDVWYKVSENPLLIEAARRGDSGTVSSLLEKGANVNFQDGAAWAPLHEAVFQGHLNVIRVLIAAGADLDIQAEAGITPLQIAVQTSDVDIVKALIAAGADLDIQDKYGRSAHDLALKHIIEKNYDRFAWEIDREHDHQEIVELLEEEQAMQRLKIKQALVGLYDPVSGISWGVDNGPGILIAQYVAG